MAAEFSKKIVEILAKRAGNHCSNPDCFALTSGPAETERQISIVGEAAHIFGANEGSARYAHSMVDAARSQEANGIWLCCTCHKIVDDDPVSYPTELLFEWKQAHTRKISENLGKAAGLREKADRERLKPFEGCSYLARQIILDKPRFWEYNLTAELLRVGFGETKYKHEALKQKFYALPIQTIEGDTFLGWAQTQMTNISNQVEAVKNTATKAIVAAWGPPGQPGSEHEILRTCKLIVETAERLLQIEETVRFLKPPLGFDKVHELFIGIAGRHLDELFKIPEWILSKTSDENLEGDHLLTLVFDMPENWFERVKAEFDIATSTGG